MNLSRRDYQSIVWAKITAKSKLNEKSMGLEIQNLSIGKIKPDTGQLRKRSMKSY